MGVLTRFSLDEVKIKRKFFHKHIGTITVLDWTMNMGIGCADRGKEKKRTFGQNVYP